MTTNYPELDAILEQVAWYGSYMRSGEEPEGPTLSPAQAKAQISALMIRERLAVLIELRDSGGKWLNERLDDRIKELEQLSASSKDKE